MYNGSVSIARNSIVNGTNVSDKLFRGAPISSGKNGATIFVYSSTNGGHNAHSV